MGDSAAVAADWIAGAALALSVAALVRGEVLAKRAKGLRNAKGPEDLRPALVEVRTAFTDIVSMGGRDRTYFRDMKQTGQNLRDLADRADDPTLRAALLMRSESTGTG
jgi:hypothetical protein